MASQRDDGLVQARYLLQQVRRSAYTYEGHVTDDIGPVDVVGIAFKRKVP